jgi:salicylate hydroxylase
VDAVAAQRPILVAGGGIAGLAFALALARRGRSCVVLEGRPRFETAGAGIQLGPNAVVALRELDVAERLRPMVGQPETLEILDGWSARRLAKLPLGDWLARRHGAPYWTVHRADLHDVLSAAVAEQSNIAVRFGFALASVRASADGVEATSASGEHESGQALVGADGLWSAVRPLIVPSADVAFAHATATRGVLPVSAAGKLAGAHVGLWLGHGVNVAHYPVRGGEEIAVVIIAREEWQASGWERPVDTATVLSRLSGCHPDLTGVLAGATCYRKWALHRLSVLPRWTEGRICLIGDAAHPMLPHLAQGGAMAIEDALILARCLDEEAVDAPAAFRQFEARRRSRVARVAALSRRNGTIYHLKSPMTWARDLTFRIAPGRFLMSRLDWLYGWRPE